MGINDKIKIVEFNPSYAEQIAFFITESMCYFNNRPRKIREDVFNIKDYYLDNGGNFWCAIDPELDKVIGTIALEKRNNYGVLKRFYVDEDYQNQNIGIGLYAAFEEYVVNSANINALYLACGKALEKARRFYYQNGWGLIALLPEGLSFPAEDDWFFKEINWCVENLLARPSI